MLECRKPNGRLLLVMVCAIGFAVGSGPVRAQSTIGKDGQLRTAFVLSDTSLVTRDRQGQLHGVLVDIANLLAAKLGEALAPVPYDNLVRLHQSIGKGAWDVAIVARDLSRARILAFSQPFLVLENGYVARPASGLLGADDVDRSSIKVAVIDNTPAAAYLSRNLKHAKLVRLYGGVSAAKDALTFGRADVFAGTVERVHEVAAGVPGASLLAGTFSQVPITFAVPKANAASLEAINDFITQATKDGTLSSVITTASVTGIRLPLIPLRQRGIR